MTIVREFKTGKLIDLRAHVNLRKLVPAFHRLPRGQPYMLPRCDTVERILSIWPAQPVLNVLGQHIQEPFELSILPTAQAIICVSRENIKGGLVKLEGGLYVDVPPGFMYLGSEIQCTPIIKTDFDCSLKLLQVAAKA